MKILAIGDPHGHIEKLKKIPKENIDLILLTGDIGKADLARKRYFENVERKRKGLPELKETPAFDKKVFMEIYNSSMNVLKYLSKYAPIYLIFGNVESHDNEVAREERKIGLKLPRPVRSMKKINDVKIINNKLINLNGVKIGGLEYFVDDIWVKVFKPYNYEKRLAKSLKETRKARKILNNFRKLEILVCHQPPYTILDKVTAKFAPKAWQGKNAGSKVILDYIKKQQPKYVFCGHIHEGEGYKRIGKTEVYNLGVCGYKVINI